MSTQDTSGIKIWHIVVAIALMLIGAWTVISYTFSTIESIWNHLFVYS